MLSITVNQDLSFTDATGFFQLVESSTHPGTYDQANEIGSHDYRWVLQIDHAKQQITCLVYGADRCAIPATLKQLPLRAGTIVLDDSRSATLPEVMPQVRSFRRPELQQFVETFGIDSVCRQEPNRTVKSTKNWYVVGVDSDGKVEATPSEHGYKHVEITEASWTLFTIRRFGSHLIRILYTQRTNYRQLKKSLKEKGISPEDRQLPAWVSQ